MRAFPLIRELGTMRRINVDQLPDNDLRRALEEAREGLPTATTKHGAT